MSSPYGGGVQRAALQSATAWTAEELIAAPAAGESIAIISLFGMSDTAGQIAFIGPTIPFEIYPGANGGANPTSVTGEFLEVLPAATALDVTSDITGEQFVHVVYLILI